MRNTALILLCMLSTICTANDDFRAGKIVYQEKSLYRNIIVAEGDGYRCMKFGRLHARQSCINIENPSRLVLSYGHGMLSSFFAIERPQSVLIIGLGGGVLPNAIHKIDPSILIHSVEIDPAVVKVAKSHFFYKTDDHSKAFENDARVFVRSQIRSGQKYDIVLIDAFDKDYIPEHLLTVEFLKQIKSILNPSGIVASNTFAAGALADAEAATYEAVFGQTFNINFEGGNRIIISGRDGLPDFQDIKERASKYRSSFEAVGIDTHEMIEKYSVKPLSSARYLTDQYSPSNLLQSYSPIEWFRKKQKL